MSGRPTLPAAAPMFALLAAALSACASSRTSPQPVPEPRPGPPSAQPESRDASAQPEQAGLPESQVAAPQETEGPPQQAPLQGAGAPATAQAGAPTGAVADGPPVPTPAPSTSEERAAARLEPTRLERVRPHLPEGTQLHGISLLATAGGATGAVDALLVQTLEQGTVEATVLVLDAADRLLAKLPRASASGPDALRVGALTVPLADRATLGALGRGEIDLDAASAGLRLAAMVARDRLLAAADEGWEAFDREPDPDVLVLGVAPAAALAPGELPTAGPFAVPQTFQVGRALPATLEGWHQSGDSWQGRVCVEARDAAGAPLVLVVGVQGRLPR